MSAAAVTQTPNISAPRSRLAEGWSRLKPGIALAGWLGIVLGALFGILAARPELLANHLHDWRVALAYRIGAILIVGLIEGLALRFLMRDRHDALRFALAVMGVGLAIILYE